MASIKTERFSGESWCEWRDKISPEDLFAENVDGAVKICADCRTSERLVGFVPYVNILDPNTS